MRKALSAAAVLAVVAATPVFAQTQTKPATPTTPAPAATTPAAPSGPAPGGWTKFMPAPAASNPAVTPSTAASPTVPAPAVPNQAATVPPTANPTMPAPTASTQTTPGTVLTPGAADAPLPKAVPGAPLAGANSFTESQAKARIEAKGFISVSGLKKDDGSIWRGQAMKDGKSVSIALDYQGNVVAN